MLLITQESRKPKRWLSTPGPMWQLCADAIYGATKLNLLGLNTCMCAKLHPGRQQTAHVEKSPPPSSHLTAEHHRGVCWAPSSSPFFFSTHDCKPSHDANTIIHFADITVVGRISSKTESAEVENLESWSRDNNLIVRRWSWTSGDWSLSPHCHQL